MAQIKDVSNDFIHPQQPTTLLIVTVFKFTYNLNALSAQATVIKRITIKELQCIEMNQKNKKLQLPAPKI